jgi:hypothetical protein
VQGLPTSFNSLKANFDDVYTASTPVPYMVAMRTVGYKIPQMARPVFEQLIHRLEQIRGRKLRVLDIGSSYGVNATLLRYDLDLDQLYDHYSRHAEAAHDAEKVRRVDRAHLEAIPSRVDASFIGIDASANAINYALEAGLLDEGHVLDLDRADTDSGDLPKLDVDLIISTGTVGYIGPRAFDVLLDLCSDIGRLWIATFALRLFDFAPFATVLAARGLVTEAHAEVFVQRNMVSGEHGPACDFAQARGLDIDGFEATGRLFANFYLSRSKDAGGESLAAMLAS